MKAPMVHVHLKVLLLLENTIWFLNQKHVPIHLAKKKKNKACTSYLFIF